MKKEFFKRPHSVSVSFPDDERVTEYEEQIAYHLGDNYDELRISTGTRTVAWYFASIDKAEDFADSAILELSGMDQFNVSIP